MAATPTIHWLNNPEFSRALIVMSGLKLRDSTDEIRGLHLLTLAYWDGTQFIYPIQISAASGPLILRFVSPSKRYMQQLYAPLGKEMIHYRIPKGRVYAEIFISRANKRLYVNSLSGEDGEPLEVPPFQVEGALENTDFKSLRQQVEFHMRDLQDVLRLLKGWGWY